MIFFTSLNPWIFLIKQLSTELKLWRNRREESKSQRKSRLLNFKMKMYHCNQHNSVPSLCSGMLKTVKVLRQLKLASTRYEIMAKPTGIGGLPYIEVDSHNELSNWSSGLVVKLEEGKRYSSNKALKNTSAICCAVTTNPTHGSAGLKLLY